MTTRFPDRRLGDLHCVRCREDRVAADLDRHLWCDSCVVEAHVRAALVGRIAGVVMAGALAAWIWLVQQPSDLVIGGWIATVLAAYWFGSRAARHVAFGFLRFKHRPQ